MSVTTDRHKPARAGLLRGIVVCSTDAKKASISIWMMRRLWSGIVRAGIVQMRSHAQGALSGKPLFSAQARRERTAKPTESPLLGQVLG